MPLVKLPEHEHKHQQWILFQNFSHRVTREKESQAEQALKHYAEPASRQFELYELAQQSAVFQTMVSRIQKLSRMELDEPILPQAIEAAKEVIIDIVTYLLTSVDLDIPNIFSTNKGRISFEWQPHKTGGNLIGSILLSVDGETADFQIERYLGSAIEVVFSEEQAELGRVRTFLCRLIGAMTEMVTSTSESASE